MSANKVTAICVAWLARSPSSVTPRWLLLSRQQDRAMVWAMMVKAVRYKDPSRLRGKRDRAGQPA